MPSESCKAVEMDTLLNFARVDASLGIAEEFRRMFDAYMPNLTDY